MCPRPEQQIVDACVRAANAMHEVEEYVFQGMLLGEVRRILVDMKYERALRGFDEARERVRLREERAMEECSFCGCEIEGEPASVGPRNRDDGLPEVRCDQCEKKARKAEAEMGLESDTGWWDEIKDVPLDAAARVGR